MTASTSLSLSQIQDLPALDYTTLQENTFGEPLLVQELLTLYQDDMVVRLDKIQAAWLQQDTEACYFELHSMKGSSGSIGAKQLEAVAVTLLPLLKERNLKQCEPYVLHLREIYNAFLQEIERLKQRGYVC